MSVGAQACTLLKQTISPGPLRTLLLYTIWRKKVNRFGKICDFSYSLRRSSARKRTAKSQI